MIGSRKSAGRQSKWRALSHGTIAGIAVFLMLIGGGVSYAAWSTGAQATSTATGANLAISTSGFGSNAFTFTNNFLTTTGSVTLTNNTVTSSTAPGTFAMTFGYTGAAALAAKLNVSVWSTPNTSACTAGATVPSGATVGLWNTVATTASPITGTLAKNASARYCLRITATERGDLASSGGSLTIQPSVSASLTVGNWSQSASASATTQTTAWIFPASAPSPSTWYLIANQSTGKCVDVYAGQTTSGTGLIDYPCKTTNNAPDYNQHWKFTHTSANYYTITSRKTQTMRMDVVGSSTSSLAAVDQQTSAARTSQEWQLQTVSSGVYQVVNRNSGMCLQPYDTSVYSPEIEYAQVTCSGSTAQRFTLNLVQRDVPAVTLSCAAASAGGVTYSWTGAAIDTYNFEAALTPGTAWTGIGDAAQGSTSITILPSAIAGADGRYSVRASWLSNQLATSDLWKITTSGTSALSCTAPLPLLNAVTCAPSPDNSVSISWGHAAPSTYTIQLFSNGNWIDLGTAASGSTSYTVAGGQYWNTGVRDLRVVSGAQSVQFNVYNSNGGQNSSTLWCWPAQTISSVTCTNQSNGDNMTLSWPRTSAGTSQVRMTIPGIDSFTRNVTYSGSTASVQFLDSDVRGVTSSNSIPATFRLEANGEVVGLLPDRNIRITGTGNGLNSRNIFCQ